MLMQIKHDMRSIIFLWNHEIGANHDHIYFRGMGKRMNQTDTESMLKSLQTVFGFHSFRTGQQEVVEAILNKRDVFAVMPTGGGKSLCYQLPACMLCGTCIVVSPLISLMKDQVDNAKTNGISAAYLNSSLSTQEQKAVLEAFGTEKLKLLYIAPERLFSSYFFQKLFNVPVSFFAIDEAHCISEWGHDFRPDYLQLAALSERFPGVPIAAFTATATQRVQHDIVTKLQLRQPHVLRASFNRPNLFYEVVAKNNVLKQIGDFVAHRQDQAGIVYRTTRKSVERTVEYLTDRGINACAYHAGLDDRTRKENQEKFNNDSVTVVVATIAFGMGIDKSNVRYIVHGDLPKNMENYYQETGRAGRDAASAHCLLLYGRGDIPKIKYFIENIDDNRERTRLNQALNAMITYAGSGICRRKQILEYFAERYTEENCGNCDICTGSSQLTDVSVEAQMLLSAVYRTGNRFGVTHVIDVLCGAETQKIKSLQHHTLKCYGVGKQRQKVFWRQLVDTLIAQRCLRQSQGQYPVIQLDSKAQSVLVGKQKVHMLTVIETKKVSVKSEVKTSHTECFNRLRHLRMTLAQQQNVPPYIIFSDKTLHEMASLLPENAVQLRTINGVGEKKMELYGEQFLDIIKAFLDENPDIQSKKNNGTARNTVVQSPKKTSSETFSKTIETTYHLLKEGASLENIAQKRNLANSTIVGHIERLLLKNRDINIADLMDHEKIKQIKERFRSLDTMSLKPIVENSGNTISYDEARLVRALIVCENRLNPVDCGFGTDAGM